MLHKLGLIHISVSLLLTCYTLNPSHTLALDPPHNADKGYGCDTCHDVNSSNPKLMPEGDVAGPTIDDTIFNARCRSCHNPSGDASDLVMMTHSSLTTDEGYGQWTVECWVCHSVHYQQQDGQNIDPADGEPYGRNIRTTVDLGNITYADATPPKSGRKSVVFKGRTGPNSFADGTGIVDGICEICHTETYHWRSDGSLAGMGVHNGEEGGNCINCHPHDRGFAVNCDGCHDFPPGQLVSNPAPTGSVTAGAHTTHTVQYSCEFCHSGSVGSGATHNSGNNTITMGFSLFSGTYQGGTYNGQTTAIYDATSTTPATDVATNNDSKTCSNLYCHGTLPGGTNWGGGSDTTPVWDGSVACGDCHRATASSAPTLGSHAKHTQTWGSFGGGYQYPCSYCHTDPATDVSLHANNRSEVIFSSGPMTTGGAYNGDDDMLGTYGTCGIVYCHSTVQSSPPGTAPTYRTTPLWGTTMSGCANCHYYSNSTPLLSTGSHASHWFSEDTTNCYTCHNYDEQDDMCFACHMDGDPVKSHANYTVDVKFLPMLGGSYSGTAPPGDAYGSCSTTYCHSDGKSVANPAIFPVESDPVNWDGQDADPQDDSFSCNNCHPYPPVNDVHETHVTLRGYECSNCHAVTTQDNVSINTWGNLSGAPGHINTLFDVDYSGQFWHGPSGQFHDIEFVYSPLPVEGNVGGECSSNTCHQRWGFTDPVRWLYFTISSGFGYTETCSPGSTVNATITNSGGTPPYECNIDWGDGNSEPWGPCSVSHDYGVRDTFTVTWQARDSEGLPMGAPNPGTEVINVCNTPPVVDFVIAPGTGTGRDVKLYDLSSDADFNTANHSGPGEIKIAWDGYNCGAPSVGRSSGVADMSASTPGNPPTFDRQHFFSYSASGYYDVYIAVKDNGGDWVCSPNKKRYYVSSTNATYDSPQPLGAAQCNSLIAGIITYPSFQFDGAGAENWAATSQLTPFTVSGGTLSTTSSGIDPFMINDCVVVSGSDVPALHVRMRTTCGTTGQFFWTTMVDGTYTEAKSQTFPLTSDGTFQDYNIPLSGNTEWTGHEIRTLRFDPINPPDATPCTIEIDYIQGFTP